MQTYCKMIIEALHITKQFISSAPHWWTLQRRIEWNNQ